MSLKIQGFIKSAVFLNFVLLCQAECFAQVSEQPASQRREPASAAMAVMELTSPSRVFYKDNAFSPDLVCNYYQMKQELKPLDARDYIPMDLKNSDSGSSVMGRIADKSFSTYFNSPEVRGTSVGQTATKVEKSMQQEVGFSDGDIQHKLQFNLEAFQETARIRYTGYTEADLRYKPSEDSLSLNLKLISDKDLIFSHANSAPIGLSSVENVSRNETVNKVSLQWGF